jgi:hypothetical protein
VISEETRAACLEEIEATIWYFEIRRPYHGDFKQSSDWHEGWEFAAKQAHETLTWLRNRLQEETANA